MSESEFDPIRTKVTVEQVCKSGNFVRIRITIVFQKLAGDHIISTYFSMLSFILTRGRDVA